MPYIEYQKYNPQSEARAIIEYANSILAEYSRQGFRLTLRQLYYQFVARDILANSQANYNKLGNIMTSARDAGMVDWNNLQDRGRVVQSKSHWDGPSDIVETCINAFNLDLWEGQEYRVEVWVEKEALVEVVGSAADTWDIPYFANKGYLSTSAAWDAGHNRILNWKNTTGQETIILHLGDHDPSGIQMTEDIQSRLNRYSTGYGDKKNAYPEVRRIALNMDQVEEYSPPPNPAKQTDARYDQYVARFGITESWELDALEPSVIVGLINDEVEKIVDKPKWEKRGYLQQDYRTELGDVSEYWEDIREFIRNTYY